MGEHQGTDLDTDRDIREADQDIREADRDTREADRDIREADHLREVRGFGTGWLQGDSCLIYYLDPLIILIMGVTEDTDEGLGVVEEDPPLGDPRSEEDHVFQLVLVGHLAAKSVKIYYFVLKGFLGPLLCTNPSIN